MQIIEEWENRDSDFWLPLGKYGELDSDFKNVPLHIPKRVIRNCKPKKDRQYNGQWKKNKNIKNDTQTTIQRQEYHEKPGTNSGAVSAPLVTPVV
jgi:hypothetical protein